MGVFDLPCYLSGVAAPFRIMVILYHEKRRHYLIPLLICTGKSCIGTHNKEHTRISPALKTQTYLVKNFMCDLCAVVCHDESQQRLRLCRRDHQEVIVHEIITTRRAIRKEPFLTAGHGQTVKNLNPKHRRT